MTAVIADRLIDRIARDVAEVLDRHGLVAIEHPLVPTGPVAGAEVSVQDGVAVLHQYDIQLDRHIIQIRTVCMPKPNQQEQNPNG